MKAWTNTLRPLCTALIGGLGLTTAVTLTLLPPGSTAGRALGAISEAISAPGIATTFVTCLAGVGLMLVLVATAGRRWCEDAGAGWRVAEPIGLALGIPLLALAVDPWVFHSVAPTLVAIGVGVGILTSAFRLYRALGHPLDARVRAPVAIATLVALAVAIPTFLVLPGPPAFHSLSGDEPHYLVIARSLWADGDLEIGREYRERLLLPFWPPELSPHAKPGIDPANWYSIHGTGLAVWLAPWYGIGQGLSEAGFTVLVRIAMTFWLAAAAAALFLLIDDIAGTSAAIRGTAAAVLTAPLLFAGAHLFPSVPALALSCAAYGIVRRGPGVAGALAAGAMLGCLPWLHFKFAAIMGVIALIGTYTLATNPERRAGGSRPWRAIAALLGPVALSGLGHTAFTWTLYRRISPLAVHLGADESIRQTAFGDNWGAYFMDPFGFLRTGIGYFMDQKEGLLYYAPHYLLAIAGLAWISRRRRFDAIALALVFGALVGPYALSQETGHWAPPARPVTGVLWTLAVPLGIALTLSTGTDRRGRALAALRGLLLAWGVGMTALLTVQNDLIYHDYGAPSSLSLLRYGAPGLPLWRLAPLWHLVDETQWLVSFLWLAAAALIGWLFWRWGASADIPGAGEPGASSGSRGAPASSSLLTAYPGLVAAVCLWLVGASLLGVHHAVVPLTGLHEPWEFAGHRVWTMPYPIDRAWAEDGGVWYGGTDTTDVLLSSDEPLDSIVFEATTLAPMRVDVRLGREATTLVVAPGETSYVRFSPGAGKRWGDEVFYHLRVVAHGAITPAALGLGGDVRGLGVFLKPLQVDPAR